MTTFDSFPWPVPPGGTTTPRWTGRNFVHDGTESRILAYAVSDSHWSDDLTFMHEAEAGRDHPIDVASRQLAVHSMEQLPVTDPTILDVGCSSGFLLEDLRQALPAASLLGADYLQGPLQGLSQRMPDIPILQFALRKCPLPDSCVDGITCLNVLEHIDDDEAAMAEIYRILKPGGIAHLEVPSGPKLYDIYDEHLMHHRRYRLKDLMSMAQRHQFRVQQATHLGFALYPAFWWTKKGNRKKLGLPAEEKKQLVAEQIRHSRNNVILHWATRFELLLGHLFNFPVGIRCVVVLSKA